MNDITDPDFLNFVHHLSSLLVCLPMVLSGSRVCRCVGNLVSFPSVFAIFLLHYLSVKTLTLSQLISALSFTASLSNISVLVVCFCSIVFYSKRICTNSISYTILFLIGACLVSYNDVSSSALSTFITLSHGTFIGLRNLFLFNKSRSNRCCSRYESVFMHLFIFSFFSLLIDSTSIATRMVTIDSFLWIVPIKHRLVYFGLGSGLSTLSFILLLCKLPSPLFVEWSLTLARVNVIPWSCAKLSHGVSKFTVMGMSMTTLLSFVLFKWSSEGCRFNWVSGLRARMIPNIRREVGNVV
ncbi:hypothetical protein P9112_004288 [Eukaryota sp. TZLM1-RC]